MAGFESFSLPNQLIWNFIFWTGLHRTIEYSMMITGHTKFEPDWHFRIWKMHWRNSNVETITEVKFYSSFNLGWFGCFIVLSTTFNNISVISWQSVLLVGETWENHWPVTSHWQTLSHNVVSSTSHHEQGSNSQF